MKNVKETLKKLRSELEETGTKSDWDDMLAETMMLRRATDRTDLKISPYKARFGTEMRLPAHLQFGSTPTRTLAAEEQQRLMERARKVADEAAVKQKARFDVDRVEVNYEINEKVFLKDHYRTKLEVRRIGPFIIVGKRSAWSYELGECDNGPKLGRRHLVVNVRDLMRYAAAETKVDDILEHRRDENWEFRVRWADGDITWEPIEHLYDEENDGQLVYNDKLVKYAKVKGLKLAVRATKSGDVVPPQHIANARKTPARKQHHKSGKVVVFASQTPRDPGPHRRIT